MNRFIFLISLMLLSNLILAQKTSMKADSIYFEKRLKEINEFAKSNSEKLERTNDSLEKELLFYRAKEDYFAAALEDQSNRFIFLATILLGLMAGVSYFGFKREVNKLKKETKIALEKQVEELRGHESLMKDLHSQILKTSVNAYMSLVKLFINDKPYVFKMALNAAKDRALLDGFKEESNKENLINKEKLYEHTIHALNLTLGLLDEIVLNRKYKKEIKVDYYEHIERLNLLINTNYDKVKDMVASIRSKLNDYMEETITTSMPNESESLASISNDLKDAVAFKAPSRKIDINKTISNSEKSNIQKPIIVKAKKGTDKYKAKSTGHKKTMKSMNDKKKTPNITK